VMLAMIDVRADLHRDEAGQLSHIRFAAGHMTMTGRSVWPLSIRLAACLDRHLRVYWPTITWGCNTRLFPHRSYVTGGNQSRRSTAAWLRRRALPLDGGNAQ
jgi:hypothetical protein